MTMLTSFSYPAPGRSVHISRASMLGILSLLMATILTGLAHSDDSPAVETPVRTVKAVQMTTNAMVDGCLDDACWSQASRLGGFCEAAKGGRASVDTEVFIYHNDSGIYVGFQCRQTNGTIRASQTKRNGVMSNDDRVTLYLDLQHDHRTIYEFTVNSLGTQAEDIPGGSAEKVEWRGDWRAAASVSPEEWWAEMYIPWRMLRYPKRVHCIGLVFERIVVHNAEVSRWPDLGTTANLHLMADWIGVQPPAPYGRTKLMTYALGLVAEGEGESETGFDVKHEFPNSLVGVLTWKPDFKTIEDEVIGLDFTYVEKYVPERRPFFMEGQRFFPPSNVFYSRRVPNVDAGVKLSGKTGKVTLGLLNAMDFGNRRDTVGMLNYDIGQVSSASLMFSQCREEDEESSVVGGGVVLDKDFRRRGRLFSNLRWLTSSDPDKPGDGTSGSVDVGWSGVPGTLSYSASLYRISAAFGARQSYVPVTNVHGGRIGISYQNQYTDRKVESKGLFFSASKEFFNSGGLRSDSYSVNWLQTYTNGAHLFAGLYRGEYQGLRDLFINAGARWRSKDLYRSGAAVLKFGTRADGDYIGFYGRQGLKLSNRLSLMSIAEYIKMTNTPYAREDTQYVVTAVYDMSSERTLACRLVGRDSDNNLSVVFRQATRAGADIYLVFGDPNALETTDRIGIKIVRTLQ